MKKIMFNDRYGLTDAVLSRRKTMTRRIIKGDFEDIKAYHANGDWLLIAETKDGDSVELKPAYEVGEEVAIAQRYSDIAMEHFKAGFEEPFKRYLHEQMIKQSAGYKNKMFVVAKLMPHRIRITDVRTERLNDISDEDCRKEGIISVKWTQWLEQDWYDLSPQKCKKHNIWTLPIFEESFLDCWAEQKKGEFAAETPRTAFMVLFSQLAKKHPNDMGQQNPWVFVYEFELIK